MSVGKEALGGRRACGAPCEGCSQAATAGGGGGGAGTALPAPQGELGLPAPDSGSGLRRGERGHPVVLGCPVCGGRLRRPWDLATTSESAGYMPGRGIAESEATTGSVTAPRRPCPGPREGRMRRATWRGEAKAGPDAQLCPARRPRSSQAEEEAGTRKQDGGRAGDSA